MTSHSRLSPSSSTRWLYCTASVAAIEKDIEEGRIIPDPPDYHGGPAAWKGTCTHEIGEYMLKGLDYSKLEMADNPEVVKCAQDYYDYVMGLMRKGSKLFVEVRVPLGDYLPDALNDHDELEEQGGTSDTIIVHTDGSMDVVDLKAGHIWVEAKGNTQARLYGLGALAEFELIYDIKEVRNHIVQPNRDNYDVETISRIELVEWADDVVVNAIDAIESGNVEFAPSDKACMWCKRAGMCKAQAAFVMQDIVAGIDEMEEELPTVANVDSLTIKQLVNIHSHAEGLKSLLGSVEEKLLERMQVGKKTVGIKLVEKGTKRVWAAKDRAIADAMLKHEGVVESDVFVNTKKLIGIGAAEKLVGKGNLDAYITKPSGALTIALSSDARPSAKPMLDAADFADLEDTE